MIAFSLSFLVFIYLCIFGYSLLPKQIYKFDSWLSILVSPAVGLAASMILFFTYSRLNFPMKSVGLPYLCVTLILIFLGIVRLRAQRFYLKNILFASVAPIGILFSAWPILKYGFSWLSYVNDDMNNYALAARRFYNFGFFEKPNTNFYNGSDYSQVFYFFHTVAGKRPGSELYLSALSLFKEGDALSIFMPGIVTLQMILLFSTLALTRTFVQSRKYVTAMAYLLFLLTPLVSLGFLYQLIGQVGGLAIAISIVALSTVVFQQMNIHAWKPTIILLAVLISAQLIWYPEIVPFIAIPLLTKVLFVNREQRKDTWKFLIFIIVFAVAILNKYFFDSLRFGLSQISWAQRSGSGTEEVSKLFPYFLKPHGLPSFIGLTSLNKWQQEPFESLAVLVSIVLLGAFLYLIIRTKIYKELPIFLVPFILLISIYLVATGNGFATFKIAMFLAPFFIVGSSYLIARFVTNVKKAKKKKGLLLISMIVVLLPMAQTTQFYAFASTSNSKNGFNEIEGGSAEGIATLIKNALMKYQQKDGLLISGALNLSQLKLEANVARGTPVVFSSIDPFVLIIDSRGIEGKIKRTDVEFRSNGYFNSFSQLQSSKMNETTAQRYLVGRNKYEIFNRSSMMPKKNWEYEIMQNPKNYLMFIDSKKGRVYFSFVSERGKAVIFQPERNPFDSETFMQSIGTTLLIEIVNPSANPVLVFNVSNTLMPQYDRRLPIFSVTGKEKTMGLVVGRGSARVQTELGRPLEINGKFYYQINIEQDLKNFPMRQSGLSNLYGKNIFIDSRRVALFATDISVVDKSELSNSTQKSKLTSFPSDITQSNLIYSGMYEDGWLAGESFFDLVSSTKNDFIFKGVLPQISNDKEFTSNLIIKVDGNQVHRSMITPGEFNIRIDASKMNLKNGTHRVELSFDREQILPKPDGRPAVLLVSTIGFVSKN